MKFMKNKSFFVPVIVLIVGFYLCFAYALHKDTLPSFSGSFGSIKLQMSVEQGDSGAVTENLP